MRLSNCSDPPRHPRIYRFFFTLFLPCPALINHFDHFIFQFSALFYHTHFLLSLHDICMIINIGDKIDPKNFRSILKTLAKSWSVKIREIQNGYQMRLSSRGFTKFTTLTVFKFAQYYFSRTPRCANLSTARIIFRAKK